MFDIIDKVGEATVEKLFMSMLEEFKPEDLAKAVEENMSLLDVTVQYRPHTLALGERLAKRFRGQKKHLTYANVMEWLSDKRPDLYWRVRFNGEAQEWMRTQVSEIKRFLFEY